MSYLKTKYGSFKIPRKYHSYVNNQLSAIDKHIEEHPEGYNWSLADFELVKLLGKGQYGNVFLAVNKQTEYRVALKVIKKAQILEEEIAEQVVNEIKIQSQLNHPHILNLFTYFADQTYIYLVMELAVKDLYSEIKRQKALSLSTCAKYIYQIADALEYCHQLHIMHRDVKPENILLTLNGDVKLADFSWSTKFLYMQNTLCGTNDYLPPEMIKGQYYSESVDNWCLGILCYELLTGKPPFQASSKESAYNKILQLQIRWPPKIENDARDFISKLLRIEGKERMSLQEAKRHPWILNNRPRY